MSEAWGVIAACNRHPDELLHSKTMDCAFCLRAAFDGARAELARSQAEVRVLREALEPFAYGCTTVDINEEPPCGDCDACKARRALASTGGEK